MQKFKSIFESELINNILDFWGNTVDTQNGGFIGKIDADNKVYPKAEKSAILNTRILWSFSAVSQKFRNHKFIELADRAYNFLMENFIDKNNNGIYWLLNYKGEILDPGKQIMAQAHAIYALSEYYKASLSNQTLETALSIFRTLEKCRDKSNGGYFDSFSPNWELTGKKKSLGSQLHMLEALTNLYSVHRDKDISSRISELIDIFMDKIIDSDGLKVRTVFDESWNLLSDISSIGHNLESVWLLSKAAQSIKHPEYENINNFLLKVVESTINSYIDTDGGIFYEKNINGSFNKTKQWWPQCEAINTLYYAYLIKPDKKYLEQVDKIWNFIKDKLIDKKHGGWLSQPLALKTVAKDIDKVGQWMCPYHNTRMCLTFLD